MPHVVPDLPSTKASQAAFSTYYLALVDDYDPPRALDAFETAEMEALLDLVPRASITKLFAVNSGTWNTAGNWYPSGVPGAGDEVCVPEGTVCTYDVNATATELNWLRIDGTLKTDPTVDTAMLFDTMVVTPLGSLIDGTRTQRVSNSVVHQWIIATSNGLIDVSWDTFMQSRGIISMGVVDVWGAYKTNYLEVATRTAPDTGATSLTLASAPTNWNVGDKIVIGATRCRGWVAGSGSLNNVRVFPSLQNDVRTLTSSSGANLGWASGLTYSHVAPLATGNGTTYLSDWMQARAYVTNLTRNVVFRPDDTSVPVHQRGHLMQMHNPAGWSMRDAEVADLGRTAKMADYDGRIIYNTTGAGAGVAQDMTNSPWWDAGASAIIFGPTFLVRFAFIASGNGTVDIVGTDAAGGAQTDTLSYSSGASYLIGTKYFLTVTSITFSTAQTSPAPYATIDAISRQINQNGVRSLLTGVAVYSTITNKVNAQGRYPFHWHKMGVTGDILENPPVLDNCTFHGSPGWLVAQHRTHGDIKNCVGYDAQGAGLVAEDGNESGLWSGNLMIGFRGNGDETHKASFNLNNLDPARSGAAYWYTGRFVRNDANIAIGAAGGFVFNTRFGQLTLLSEQFDQPTALRATTDIVINLAPIANFRDNKSIACPTGMIVIKGDPRQHSDLRSHLVNFKAWSCPIGQSVTYTAHYTFTDTHCLYGFVDGLATSNGMQVTATSSDQAVVRPVLEGYEYGLNINHEDAEDDNFADNPLNGRIIISPTFIDCDNDYEDFDAVIDLLYDEEDSTGVRPTLSGLTVTEVTSNVYSLTGTKTWELGTLAYPFGHERMFQTPEIYAFDYGVYGFRNISANLTAYGYWTDGASSYLMAQEWFASPYTGENEMMINPIDVTALNLTGKTNHGTMSLSDNTAPVLADFTVEMVRNTNKDVDVLALATGNTVSFGGFTRPMKTFLIDNGDGTITAIPSPDENYTETCYVWVKDKNGNTTRATMTINVNKRALYLGRQDLLAT